jgi:putative ATPase
LNLFDSINQDFNKPLAEQARPSSLDHFVENQPTLKIIRDWISKKFLPNIILYGPPGSGKTTLARLIGQSVNGEYIQLNAAEVGAKILREESEKARERRIVFKKTTLIFIDEIHRLNKSQQDVLLPFMESGDITLIGATTENPSYELNRALLSRSRVIRLIPHTAESLNKIALFCLEKIDEVSPEKSKKITPEILKNIIDMSRGDARRMINAIEILIEISGEINPANLIEYLGDDWLGYDKNSSLHYDYISAFIKSMRGSHPDAALFYMAAMLKGGEDPRFICRRMVIFASEDIGNADPRALEIAINCMRAVELIGLPECEINMAQGVTYLSLCPKSNSSYSAWKLAKEFVESTSGAIEPPPHLKSPAEFGSIYKYPHDFQKPWVEQNYWPDKLKSNPPQFYTPRGSGFEKNLLEYWRWLKSIGV